MILAIECIAACLIFSAGIVGSVLHDGTAWLHEYAPEVQQRFIERNPDYVPKPQKKQTFSLVIAKLLVCLLFAAILTSMVWLAGARDFITGAAYSYIIWSVVNIFDAIVLDIGIFAHWKKVRLPGTEDMDAEYASNTWKSLKDGIFGMLIGIPVACVCGLVIILIV